MRQKEVKYKSDQIDLILKSYYEYYMLGLQKGKNDWNIATGEGYMD